MTQLGDRRRRLATRLGWATGILLVLVMAAGSDRPPPPGFLLIVGYGALLAALIGRVLPRLLGVWDTRGAGAALVRAALWGLLGGLALWALTVVGTTGAVGAAGLTAAARLLDRWLRRP